MLKVFNKYPYFCHFILASTPLLIILAILYLVFPDEKAVMFFFQAHSTAHPTLKKIATFATNWGNAALYPVYLYFLIKGYKCKDKAKLRFALIFLAVQLTVSLLLVRITKIAIGRPRPGEGVLFEPFSTKGSYNSLPSGHTSEIYGATLPLILRYKNLLFTLFLSSYATFIAFTRIYLSWHHPSDVFFGWMFGSVAGYAVHIFANEVFNDK